MILSGVLLLLLHRGYALVPVITVEPGEAAFFSCALSPTEISHRELYWYKQVPGDTLKTMVIVRKSTGPSFSDEFPKSRVEVKYDSSFINLTILRTRREDEGTYHCAVTEWIRNTEWCGYYLSVRGNPQRTSNYTVVQQPTLSGPERPGDSRTLQCSVLSDSENKTCPGGLSVFWFRAGSDKSHPDIIYTDGNRRDGCEETSEPQRSCVYHFSKSVSSSDAGTYYCAVATCGQILFGDGDKVDTEGTSAWTTALISLLGSALALSLTVIAVLIYAIKKNNDNCNATLGEHKNCGGWRSEQLRILKRHEVYSAVLFTTMKTKSREERDEEAAEKERIYTAVKAFGLDQ